MFWADNRIKIVAHYCAFPEFFPGGTDFTTPVISKPLPVIRVKSPTRADQTTYLRRNKANEIGNETWIILVVPRLRCLLDQGNLRRSLRFRQHMCPTAQLNIQFSLCTELQVLRSDLLKRFAISSQRGLQRCQILKAVTEQDHPGETRHFNLYFVSQRARKRHAGGIKHPASLPERTAISLDSA
ncbi:hypothetical protein [Rhizobium leucaenae]|uniref:hypothetical protein n=1 Tax=Rhizobium leucaenae TaxID=29450 RepID=UPI00168B8816|nr:hypothetical protein [Rhizobium leucaenae]